MTKVGEDEKTSSEELKKAKTRYEELFKEANVVITTTDPEGYIKKVNNKAEEVSGYSEDELIGKNILKLAHPNDEERFIKAWNRVLEGELEEIVVRIKTKKEDTRWLKVGGSPIRREGETVEIQYTAQDITELKEAEERARREEKRFKELFRGSNDLVATTDLEGKIKKVNEKGWRFFGYTEKYTKDDLIGRNIIELAHPDDRDNWFEIYNEVMENKEATKVLRGIDKDGNTVWLKTGGRAIMEGDEIVELQYNSQDITQIKKAKERQDLLHSLLRHDVRNKAQVVQGYLETAQTYDLPEDLEDYLSKARKGLSEALEIIEKIRTLKQAEKEEVKEINLEPLIDKAVENNKSVAPDMEFLNEVNCPKEGCNVQGGPLLSEVFSNIIENSVQHSEGRKIKITNEPNNGEMNLIIEDDGKGIPDENKDLVFEKGFTTAEKRGTGLGLFLAKKLIEIYNGEIEVEDSDLGGARFEVSLQKT